jgi:hypothetical protein
MQDFKEALGPAGWIGFVAVVVGALVRVMKAGKMNDLLARFNLRPIPKPALPWLSLVLGYLTTALEAKIGSGASWGSAAASGLWGLVSGALAVAGNETMSPVVAAASPAAAAAVFGKKPIDEPAPAANAAPLPPPLPLLFMSQGVAFVVASVAVLGGLTACAPIMAALPTVIAAVTDAVVILDQIEAFVDAYFARNPDPPKQALAAKAIAKTRASLNTALRTSRGTEELNQERVDQAFAEFRAAYQDLLVVVGPLGVRPPGALTAAPASGEVLEVPEPEALHLSVRR